MRTIGVVLRWVVIGEIEFSVQKEFSADNRREVAIILKGLYYATGGRATLVRPAVLPGFARGAGR